MKEPKDSESGSKLETPTASDREQMPAVSVAKQLANKTTEDVRRSSVALNHHQVSLSSAMQ